MTRMTTRQTRAMAKVLEEVRSERYWQHARFGELGENANTVRAEVYSHAIGPETPDAKRRSNLIALAASAVAAVEAIDRRTRTHNQAVQGAQHD